MDGIVSKTPSYPWHYVFTKPFYPLFKSAPTVVTSIRQLGFAVVVAARRGAPKTVLESVDINAFR
jgi:hypothetical protein